MTEVKICPKCKCNKAVADFFSKKGKQTKICQHCRDKSNDSQKRTIKNRQASIIDHENIKLCKSCLKIKQKSEFKVFEDETVSVQCIACLEKAAKRHAEKIDDDPLYVKNRQDIRKKSVENNPERTKYTLCKSNAKERNIEFSITYEEAYKLYYEKCFYCEFLEEESLNGIDRFNNVIGYLKSNCVPCCQWCNMMKLEWSYESWISNIGHILMYNGKIGKLCYESLYDTTASTFSAVKARANKHNFTFTLTLNEFKEITANDCYICGHKNTRTHSNGLDRVINDIGYELLNCRSCCGTCNSFKMEYTHEEFLKQCERIYVIHGPNVTDQEALFKKNKRIKT